MYDPRNKASVYVEPERVGFQRETADSLIELISQFSVVEVIPILARFNVALQAGVASDRGLQLGICRFFFSPKTANLLLSDQGIAQTTPLTPVHFRLAIWLLLAYGGRNSGQNLASLDDRRLMGRILLNVPFALTRTVDKTDDQDLAFLKAELDLAHSGYRSSTRPFEDFCVKGFIVKELIEKLALKDVLLDERGYTPGQFQTAITALWLHFRNHTPAFIANSSASSLNFDYMMGQVHAPKAVGNYILKELTHDLDAPYGGSASDRANLAELAFRPLAVHDGMIICLDLDYMQVRAARSMWNLASDLAKRDGRQGKFTNEAGDYFEAYCNRLLRAAELAGKEHGAWMAPPELLKQTADGLFVCGNIAVIFEMKCPPLPVKAMFSTDPRELATAIQDKVITGKVGDPRGFIQCANHLRMMLSNQALFHLKSVTTIIPCVITMEDALTWMPCYGYTTHKAKELFAEFGDLVARPTILHTEDLGMLAERSALRSLPEMILKISEGVRLADACTKNIISKHWSEEWLEASGKRVDMTRPIDFVDQAIDYLESFPESVERSCPDCSRPLIGGLGRDGLRQLWCPGCSRSFEATEEDEARLNSQIEERAASYRSQPR